MRTFRIFAASLLIISALPVAFAAETGKITRIVDGDTFKAKIGAKTETVRIIGIDTPETVDPRKPVQCFGKEASKKLQSLLNRKTVSLVADPAQDRDKYRRLLRYVEFKEKDIGAAMIEQGYAFSYKTFPHPRLDAYNELEKAARGASKGLWRACPSSGSPNTQGASPNSSRAIPSTSQQSSKASSTDATTQCSIKGNISAKREKIYHVQGCASYNITQIDMSAGERWFCSESEAVAAGWRKAGNCH